MRSRRLILLATMLLMGAAARGQVPSPAARVEDPAAAPEVPEHLVRVLRTTNKAQTNHYVSETLTFNNVNPYDVINFLWAPLAREQGGIYSYVNPDMKSGKVVVICPAYQLPWLRKMAEQLDKPNINSAPGSKYVYYRLRHRSAADPGLLTVASYFQGRTGVLLPDVATDSILIFDAPTGTDEMQNQFEQILDQPLRQVELAVKIYEVSVGDDGTLGLDYTAWKNGPGRLLGSAQAAGSSFNLATSGHAGASTSGAGYYLDYPAAFFDFLAAKGKAEVLTDTMVQALNRVPAVVQAGDEVLYYETTTDSAGDRELTPGQTAQVAPGLTFQSGAKIAAADAGLRLALVPTIGDKTVTVDLSLKVVSLQGFDGLGRPVLDSRAMADTIAVGNDQTVLFGGLSRERSVKTTRKVPLLGSLPVIGYVFGGEVTTTHRSIVVTSLTPHLAAPGAPLAAEAVATARRATGQDVVVLPTSEFCFEQGAGSPRR